MTALGKVLLSVLLVSGGFVLASVFGPPDLADRLADQLTPGGPADAWGELRPDAPSSAAQAYLSRSEFDRTLPPRAELQRTDATPSFSPTPIATPMTAPSTALAASGWPASPPPAASIAATPTTIQASNVASQPTPWPAPGFAGVQQAVAETSAPVQPPRAASPRWSNDPLPPAPSAQPATEWPPVRRLPPQPSAPYPTTSAAEHEPPAWRAAAYRRAAPPVGAWEDAVRSTSTPTPPIAAPVSPYAMNPAPAPAETPTVASPAPQLLPVRPVSDPVAAPPEVARTHIVTDGDTLARLAQQYLGDALRAADLYQWNRDTLRHPELLPIGVELRLSSPGQAVQANAGDGLGASDPVAPIATAPRARLLAPRPAGLVGSFPGR